MTTQLIINSLGNLGVGAIYSYLSSQNLLFGSVNQKIQMTAFGISAATQTILNYSNETRVKDPEVEKKGKLTKKTIFKNLLPFILIGSSSCLSSTSTLKTNLLSSILLSSVQSTIGVLSSNYDYNKTNYAVFGELDWDRHYGKVTEVPKLPRNIKNILGERCPFDPSKTVGETHFLTLIPECVDSRHLTLNLLGELSANPKRGYINSFISRFSEIGENKAQKSHWILMTKQPVSKDGVKWVQIHEKHPCSVEGYDEYRDPREFLRELHAKFPETSEYRFPTTLEAAICLITHHVRKGDDLVKQKRSIFTSESKFACGFPTDCMCCLEELDSKEFKIVIINMSFYGIKKTNIDHFGENIRPTNRHCYLIRKLG